MIQRNQNLLRVIWYSMLVGLHIYLFKSIIDVDYRWLGVLVLPLAGLDIVAVLIFEFVLLKGSSVKAG